MTMREQQRITLGIHADISNALPPIRQLDQEIQDFQKNAQNLSLDIARQQGRLSQQQLMGGDTRELSNRIGLLKQQHVEERQKIADSVSAKRGNRTGSYSQERQSRGRDCTNTCPAKSGTSFQ